MKLNWLFFKQGFKSIFKFKIQFFVVILLTFVACFYLATTTSLNQRMNKAYQQVVGNYEKFDYTYTQKADESTLLDSDFTFMPILDFVPSQTNYIKNGSSIFNDSFNLVLNNHGMTNMEGYESTFITRTFFNEDGKPTEKMSKLFGKNSGLGYDAVLQLTLVDFDEINNPSFERYNGIFYKTNFNKKLWDFSGVSSNEIFDRFLYELIKMLSDQLYVEIQSGEFQKSGSLFSKYWVENKLEFDKDFKRLSSETYDKNTYIKDISSLNENQVYIYNAIESVSMFVTAKLIDFLVQSYTYVKNNLINDWNWKEQTGTTEEKIRAYISKFNKLAEENHQMKITTWNTGEIPSGEWTENVNYNIELAFEYIFGTQIDTATTIKENYVVKNESDKKDVYAIKLTDQSDIKKYNYILNYEQNGLRGVVNPVNLYTDENNGNTFITSSKTKNDTFAFERVNKGEKIINYINGKNNNYNFDEKSGKTRYEWNNIYANYMMHQKMAGEAKNIELFIREEAFLYDRNTKINYRFVMTDDDYDFNFKVLAGLEAMQSNEIVISQQFAFKNNKQIGDVMHIGNSDFVISGFGSDALTYYPLVDPELPLTDVKNSVIVYAPKYVIKNIMDSGSEKDIIFSTSYFIRDKIKESKTFEKRMAQYDASLMSDRKNLSKNYLDSNNENINYNNFKSPNKVKAFEDTYYNLNWELQPKLIKIVSIISIVSSILILILAFVSIIFAIKKMIDNNSSQISYLKAMGTSSWKISFSYLGYGLIILALIVPLAWITAGMFQEVVSKVFATYFSSTLYEFVFNYKILLLLLVLFGLGSIIFSYMTALIITNKGVLEIMNKENIQKARFLTNRVKLANFSLVSFKFKFPMKIAIRGFKQIVMISVTAFIAAITITIAASVPSMLTIYIRDAAKYFEYENVYKMDDLVTGIPTAKKSLTASRGLPTTEKLYTSPSVLKGKTNSDTVTDIYFDNNKYYSDKNWDSSLLPPILFAKGWNKNGQVSTDFNWTEKWIFDNVETNSNATKQDTSKLLKIVQPAIGQLGNMNGISISAGMFEKISSYIWNTSINPNTGKTYFDGTMSNDSIWTDKRNLYVGSAEFIQTALKLVINLMASGENGDIPSIQIPNNTTWKEDLILLALAFLPSSGQQYLKDSPNRATQFGIGFNTENYTPNKETLSTEVKAQYGDSKNINITGIKSNQHVYKISNQDNDNVFIKSQEAITKLNDLFKNPNTYKGGDIVEENGFVIWNDSSKTLNIPTLTSLKSSKSRRMSSGLEINSLNSTVLGNDEFIIPTNAWIYDNREISENQKLFSKELNMSNESWINPSKIDPSKFTHTKQFDYSSNFDISSVSEESKWFINALDMDNSNKIEDLSYELRPYYNYNNLKLFLPKAENINVDKILAGANANLSVKSKYATNSWKANMDSWHGSVSIEDVPNEVKESWGGEYSQTKEWEWISPFNMLYGFRRVNGPWIQNVENDLKDIYSWATDVIKPSGSGEDLQIKTISEKPKFINTINLVEKAIVPTYNGDIVAVDQDILNLLTNKSTAKYIPVDYDFYGDPINDVENGLVNGKLTYKDHNITIREMKTPLELLQNMNENKNFFMKQELMDMYGYSEQEAFEQVIQNRDFNNKYSAYPEAYGITTGINGVLKSTPGMWSLNGNNDNYMDDLGSTYNKIELVGTQLGVIINISESLLLVSLFLISGIVIVAMLIITIITDIYIMRYTKFIVTMKSLGYSNKSIIVNSILLPAIIADILVIVGYFMGHWILGLAMLKAQSFGIFIPLIIHPWIPLLAITLIFVMFAISYVISLKKPLTEKLTTLT